jgi:hypothetical protein
MSLLVPLALLGLLTVPVILLLHLLRNRREQLNIPSLRLWRGLEQKKHGEMPRRIPLSLLLFLQLLVAIALTLSLTRPALSFILARPQHSIFILDISTSMLARDGSQTSRFDLARQFIQTELQKMAEQDTYTVISLAPRPEILLAGNGQQVAQSSLALDNLIPGATGVDLPAALTLANSQVKSPDREYRIIVLTDGNYSLETGSLPELLAPVTWQTLPAESAGVANQALLNVSSTTWPDGRHRLFARAINYGDRPATRSLRVAVGQTVFDEIQIELEPQGEVARVWTLPALAESVTVELVQTDALPVDNRADLLLRGPSRHRVLLVSDTPDLLGRALEVQPGLELAIDSPEAVRTDLAEFDLVVFDGIPPALTSWPAPNILVVNPSLGHPLLTAEHFARALRPDPDSSSALLAEVDLSGVYFDRVPQLVLPDWAEVDLQAFSVSPTAAAESQIPLIFQGTVNDSRLVVWAFDLAESNLPARLALPILTANTVSTLVAPSPPAVVPVGEPVLIDGNFSVETPGGQRLSPSMDQAEQHRFTRTKQPGLYRIYNRSNQPVAGFAVQAGSAMESNLSEPLQPEMLDLTYRAQPAAVTPEIEYQEFWPWLAGLALAVFVVEGWLAWRR